MDPVFRHRFAASLDSTLETRAVVASPVPRYIKGQWPEADTTFLLDGVYFYNIFLYSNLKSTKIINPDMSKILF
jgi:hypothetical protein